MSATVHIESRAAAARDAVAAQLILRLSSGYVASAAMFVVLDLGIADRLASGPRSVADLAAETGVSADALYRVLRALASIGVFTEAAPGVFDMTMAAALLRDVPGSLRAATRWMTDPLHFKAFAHFADAVRTGGPVAEAVLGRPLFEALADDPRLSQVFNDGMAGMSAAIGETIVRACSFADDRIVVDVGGGHGALLAPILREWPHLRGILFDTAAVVAGANGLLAAAGVGDRCERVGGDFFERVPPAGDVYVMKHVLHDWPDERAIAILRNIAAALGTNPRGRLLVIEAVLGAAGAGFGPFIDLAMLALVGGRERTAPQFAALLDHGGFELVRVIPTGSFLSVIEARRRRPST